MGRERWSCEKAWEWYNQTPWLRGCNFLPSDCCNHIAFWQELDFEKHLETCDPQEIRIIKQFCEMADADWAEKNA